MSWSFLGSAQNAGAAATSNDTSGSTLNTTGANLIVVAIVDLDLNAIGSSSLTDTQSNSYTLLTPANYDNTSGNNRAILGYCFNPITVSSGFFVTYSNSGGNSTFSPLGVGLFGFTGSGTPSLDQSIAANSGASTVTSQAAGSITPSHSNEVVISMVGLNGTAQTGDAVSTGTLFTIIAFNSGVSYGLDASYLIQTSAAAVNPSFSWTGANNTAAINASFALPATGGQPTSTLPLTGAGLVWGARKLHENPTLRRRELILPKGMVGWRRSA